MKGVQKYEGVGVYFPVRAFYVFVFHQVHPKEKVCLTLITLLNYSSFFGMSTIVFYIFILVSYFRMRSEHALLNIP